MSDAQSEIGRQIEMDSSGKRKTLCVDFDGTIVESDFPRIGLPVPGAIETLLALKQAGWKLILYTCREDRRNRIDKRYLTDAVEWCREQGIEFDAVNESPMDDEFRGEDSLRRKPYADVYIDDRNFGGLPSWSVIYEVLMEKKYEDK